MFYSLVYDADGTVIGTHAYGDEPETYPSNEIACTEHEAQNHQQYAVVNGVIAPAPAAQLLAAAQAAQIATMYAAYQSAIAQDVSFTTAAGVTQTFQADADSMDKVQKMLSAYSSVGVPAGFWWKSSDNTHVAFTLADLQGLAKTMGDQGWTVFQRLDARKASIMSATTLADVQAIVW